MSLYGNYIQEAYIQEGLFKKLKERRDKNENINKNLRDKIDGKYPWYFINIITLKGSVADTIEISLYGFDEKPRHPKSEGILSYHGNTEITHKLYTKQIKGVFNEDNLDDNIKKYAKYNTGAAYSK